MDVLYGLFIALSIRLTPFTENKSNSKKSGFLSLSHDLARYYDIVPWDIAEQISTMQGSYIICHEHFVVVIDINNSVMATPATSNGHHDVTELPVTSQWF